MGTRVNNLKRNCGKRDYNIYSMVFDRKIQEVCICHGDENSPYQFFVHPDID